jgi:hypothetical protein
VIALAVTGGSVNPITLYDEQNIVPTVMAIMIHLQGFSPTAQIDILEVCGRLVDIRQNVQNDRGLSDEQIAKWLKEKK